MWGRCPRKSDLGKGFGILLTDSEALDTVDECLEVVAGDEC